MLWEQLVTEGHVRAARLRRIQPWLIAIGIVLLWAGFLIADAGPEITASASVPGKLQERLLRSQQRASAAFASLPAPPPVSPDLVGLPPVRELPELVATIRSALEAGGDLPEDDVDFVELDVEAFWKGDWPVAKVAYLEDDGTYLFGALVQRRYGAGTQAVRWVGAMRQFGPKWQYATLAGPHVEGPPGEPMIRAEQVSVSLADTLPELPEPTNGQAEGAR